MIQISMAAIIEKYIYTDAHKLGSNVEVKIICKSRHDHSLFTV